VIRRYRDTDCDAIIDTWFAASRIATPFLSDEFLAQERDNIRRLWLPKADTWVFETEDGVAGFLSLLGNEVGALFVHPDAQGRGIGTSLMDHAVSLHDGLVLDVFEANAIGRRFYERYGFRLESRQLHETSGQMQRRLVFTAKRSPAVRDDGPNESG